MNSAPGGLPVAHSGAVTLLGLYLFGELVLSDISEVCREHGWLGTLTGLRKGIGYEELVSTVRIAQSCQR